MLDQCDIQLPNANSTRSAGESLANTLYGTPITITVSGDLGAGKTTFLQSFFAGLGIKDPVTSPTYALEQRYESPLGTISHIDLYRLDSEAAIQFMEELDDDAIIRCIEWPERANITGDIALHLSEDDKQAGRQLHLDFRDMQLPTKSDITLWRDEVALPDNIQKHCDAVADFANMLAQEMLRTGTILRPLALRRAAEVHDLLRFIDFTPGAGPTNSAQSDQPQWQQYKEQFAGQRHETACADFLRQYNYNDLADIVAVHGLQLPAPKRTTIEQKLLFYADKRVMQDTVVSLEERFADFRNRYTDGKHTEEGQIWHKEAQDIEQELFPLGPIS